MASPVAIGAGVAGGTAAVGATSVAAYHSFKKNGTAEENKSPDLKTGSTIGSDQTNDKLVDGIQAPEKPAVVEETLEQTDVEASKPGSKELVEGKKEPADVADTKTKDNALSSAPVGVESGSVSTPTGELGNGAEPLTQVNLES
ncbi:hypothetical protein [Candidatus Mycoplasma haematohominis]|uniref:hypothetical protein n=1 Tax=Candidatus Mycoplasma haematohominis TaxID=1494318 RepID=UPI001C0A6F77|nr:hypothetical protein [Candidatus Mycoplasma haemohominis]